MGRAHELRTFAKCQDELGYCVLLGPLLLEKPLTHWCFILHIIFPYQASLVGGLPFSCHANYVIAQSATWLLASS